MIGVGGNGEGSSGREKALAGFNAAVRCPAPVMRCDFPRSVTITTEIIRFLNEPRRQGTAPRERLSEWRHEPGFSVPLDLAGEITGRFLFSPNK